MRVLDHRNKRHMQFLGKNDDLFISSNGDEIYVYKKEYNWYIYSYIFILLQLYSSNGINIILIFIFLYLIVVLKIVFEKIWNDWKNSKFINFNIYVKM